MVIFLSVCVEGILWSFTNFYLHRKFLIFLRNDRDCKAVEALNIFEKLSWLKGCFFEGILQLFTYFYLHRKVSILWGNSSDCKDVDLYNRRKRYAVIESLDRMRNTFWLASCFSKWRNPISIVQEIKVWLPVFAFLTQLLLPWEQCFIDLDNHELPGWMTLIQRTIVPCWKDAVGLGSIVCRTKSKKRWKRQLICWWQTFHWQEEAIKHDGCKGCFKQWWAYAYSSHSKADSFCRMGFGKICFDRRPTVSHG